MYVSNFLPQTWDALTYLQSIYKHIYEHIYEHIYQHIYKHIYKLESLGIDNLTSSKSRAGILSDPRSKQTRK